MVIRYLRSANISLYHTMVLSAVTHSLVIGRKVRNEDPTADTSMVTRPPHHTYTIRMHSGGRAAADIDPEVAVNFTNISIQQLKQTLTPP